MVRELAECVADNLKPDSFSGSILIPDEPFCCLPNSTNLGYFLVCIFFALWDADKKGPGSRNLAGLNSDTKMPADLRIAYVSRDNYTERAFVYIATIAEHELTRRLFVGRSDFP